MKAWHTTLLITSCTVLLLALTAGAQVTAITPYTVSTFATSVQGVYFQPDSIAEVGGHIFIGFGDGAAPDGSDGKSSSVVEYDRSGNVLKVFTVKGHNDGLRVDPKTQLLWAMQNEDGNPNLVIIDPVSGSQTLYTFGPTPHGGGYDDIAFRGNDVFISASNPAHNPNSYPAIVRATITGSTVNVSPVLMGTATATDIPTDTPIALNLLDPDSMKFDPFGDLVLDSQADGELIILHHAGALDQSVYHLALTLNGTTTQIDDTVYATASHGVILVSDLGGDTIYSITKDIFSPGAAYSAAPTSMAATNLNTGVLTNIITGMVSPHGMIFLRDEDAQ
jgi:hypothetical protein